MLASPTLPIAQCLITRVDNNAMNLPIKLSSEKQKEIEIVEGFLDCGAGGKFINQNYTRMKGIKMEALKEPIRVYNVDGTPRNHQILCGLENRSTWLNLKRAITGNWTRETQDHPRAPLAL